MDSLYTVQEVLFAQTRPDIPREPNVWERPPVVDLEETTVAGLEDTIVGSFSSAA
jgi:hypothetical protein